MNTRELGSGITTPTDSLRPAARLRAARFGTYPSSAAVRSTARRASSLTEGLPLNTLDAVARDTPAALATWSRVAGDRETASIGWRK